MRRLTRRHTFVVAGAMVVLFAVGGAAAAAAACKLALDCRGLLGRTAPDVDPPPIVAPGGASFARGFVERVVARGLVEPTDFAFLHDGRILVAEKRGLVRMIVGGGVARRPVLDLRGGVSTYRSGA